MTAGTQETFSTNSQQAPYPLELVSAVGSLTYKKGWKFWLSHEYDRGQGSRGLTLIITITTPNSYRPEHEIRVSHLMPVPPAAYNVGSWQRWLLEQILLVERHEACEFFTLAGEKVFAPNHGPGEDPYTIHEPSTGEQRRTSFRGDLNPGVIPAVLAEDLIAAGAQGTRAERWALHLSCCDGKVDDGWGVFETWAAAEQARRDYEASVNPGDAHFPRGGVLRRTTPDAALGWWPKYKEPPPGRPPAALGHH